jgi:hypothetical protein
MFVSKHALLPLLPLHLLFLLPLLLLLVFFLLLFFFFFLLKITRFFFFFLLVGVCECVWCVYVFDAQTAHCSVYVCSCEAPKGN